MKHFTEVASFIQPLDGWLSSHEAYFLYTAAKEARGKGEIVEIGSWKGKSTICLASGTNGKKVFAVDPHKGEYSKGKGIGKDAPTYKEFLLNLKHAGVEKKVLPLVATSEEAAKKWQSPITFIFIDGLHDYKHTKQDYDLWSRFVTSSGVIAFHDAFCGHEGPERVVLEDIFARQDVKEIGVVGSIIYVKIGIPSLFQSVNLLKNKLLIAFALQLNHQDFPFKFMLLHRVVKLLLLNEYTAEIIYR